MKIWNKRHSPLIFTSNFQSPFVVDSFLINFHAKILNQEEYLNRNFFFRFLLFDLGKLRTIGRAFSCNRKSLFEVNFHASLSSLFVDRIWIASILLIISFEWMLMTELTFYCFEYIIKSIAFALWSEVSCVRFSFIN